MTLAWSPSPDPTVVGYRVYYGVASRTYTNLVDVGNSTNATISGLVDGTTYYFAATSYNSLGMESVYSSEVVYTVPGASGNQPPTLDPLTDLTINEDSGPRTVNLSGITSGSTNESQTLTVTVVSGNTALIPTPAVSYNSPNTTGTLTFAPVTNAYGSATITVTVNDHGASNNLASQYFVVTVSPVNDPPTLNPIANLAINENAGLQTVPLSGITSGAANETQTLNVTASSSNTGLIPNPTVNYSSPASTGTLTFTPVANAYGSAVITVTVNDNGGGTSTISHNFTVTVNAPPTIGAIADQTIATNTSTGPISFTIADNETPAASLTLSAASSAPALIPVSNIVFGGSGANRTVTLTPLHGQSGSATITVTVSDGSATAARAFQLNVLGSPQPPANLYIMITTNGAGIITPDLNGQQLTPGQQYTVTAVPSSGNMFAGWSGSIASSEPQLTFLATSNLALQANFVSTSFSQLAGTYSGLFFEDDQVRLMRSGSVTVTVTPRGTYSGRVQVGARRCSISGNFDSQARALNAIYIKGLDLMNLDLRLGAGPDADRIFGHLSGSGFVATVQGDRAVFNAKTNPAPYAGTYTLLLPGQAGAGPAPAGNGFGAVRVDAKGNARFTGTLADGAKVSQSAMLSKHGEWPFYVPLYSGNGSVLSWLTFTNGGNSDLGGDLSWIKLPNGKARYYPGGFTNVCETIGSTYVRPLGSSILNLTTAQLEFCGGNLTCDFTNTVALGLDSKVLPSSANRLSMSFSLSTGTFKGKATDPSTGTALPFSGAVLQKMNAGYGFLLGTDQSSHVAFEP